MIRAPDYPDFAGHGGKPCSEAHNVSHERRALGSRVKTKFDLATFPDSFHRFRVAVASASRAATAGRLPVCTACDCAGSRPQVVGPQPRKNSLAGRPRKRHYRARSSANFHRQHGVSRSPNTAARVANPFVVWLQRQSTTRCFASGRRTVPPKLSPKANRLRR